LELGFTTSRAVAGDGDDPQAPKALARKQQASLLAQLADLAVAIERIDADENLTPQGKTARRRELGQAFVARLKTEEGQRIVSITRTKRDLARVAMRKAQEPAGETEIGRLTRIIEQQHLQQFLLAMDPQGLRVEFQKAMDNKDSRVYSAVMALPRSILHSRGFTAQYLDNSEATWNGAVNTVLSTELQDAEIGTQVAEADLAQVERIVRQECSVPEERVVKTLS